MKVRSNTWITRDIVKMMYGRDRIHELAVKRKDNVLMEKYRKMGNTITDIIKNRKREYFSELSNSLRTSPRSLWSELTTMMPKLIWNQLPKIWVRMILIFIFKMFLTLLLLPHSLTIVLLWKGQGNVYTFKFDKIQRTDLLWLFAIRKNWYGRPRIW